jgi:transmembrane sensor
MTDISPMDVEKCAADWLASRDRDDWSVGDQAKLDAWLAEAPAHEVAYWRLETAWTRTERLAALRRPRQASGADTGARLRTLGRVAGTLGVAAVIGFFVLSYAFRTEETRYETGVGGHKRITLADGSLVELNTDTALRAVLDRSERKVVLDRGEAYFHIVHQTDRPFVVVAGDERITDLGTAFVLRRDEQQLKVTLIEGRARLETVGYLSSKAVDLRPGDEIIANVNRMTRTHKTSATLSENLGWRHDLLIFDGTTLADAVSELNRYSQIKLVITDSKVARMTINGTFRTGNLLAFVDATQVVLGLNVTTRGDKIVISK